MATSITDTIEVTLRNGRRVTIRPIRRDDVARTAAFIDALSTQSKHSLFLGGIARLSDDALQRLCISSTSTARRPNRRRPSPSRSRAAASRIICSSPRWIENCGQR